MGGMLYSETWENWIREYSQRELTMSSDRLPAFRGLANAFGRSFGLPSISYHFGMWEDNLMFDLSWFRAPISLDVEARDAEMGKFPGTPSYSWANVIGPVKFEDRGILRWSSNCTQGLRFITMSDDVPGVEVIGHIFQLKRGCTAFGEELAGKS